MRTEEIEIFARTIYGEARGEYTCLEGGLASLIAVGNVVMNRLKAQSRYGKTIQEVCQKPWQFSCWNENDPNRVILMKGEIVDPIFIVCREVASNVITHAWPDLTRGSDHYHATTLFPLPPWARGRQPKVRFANHIFYQLTKGD